MATATEISTRALKRIRRTDSNATPDATDIADATEALTAMIASWEAEGLSGDVLPLDSRFEQAVVAMLAVRIAEDFGATPGPVLLRDAENGWGAIQAAYFAVPETRFEDGVANTGAFTNPALYFNGEEDVLSTEWQASTAYYLRAFVINNANRYELVTEGTSASSGGPTGTDASITDGTCVWCWRGVTAE
jgi:hypothetical protein